MSELIQKEENCSTIRWRLFTSASALVLTASISVMTAAQADDADQPTVWLELGGQLNRLGDGQETFSPPFLAQTPSIFPPLQHDEHPPLYSLDEFGSIQIAPEGSSWHLSASIRYGRAVSKKSTHHQTYTGPYPKYIKNESYTSTNPVNPLANRFTDAKVRQTETHAILDFDVGRDFGLGLFGKSAQSSLNFGVRFAQFTSKSRNSLKDDPDWRFDVRLHRVSYYGYQYAFQEVYQPYHSFAGTFSADRSFNGLGPSLSWKSEAPFLGNPQQGELTFDWGVNAALLFGRQKARTHHQTTAHYHPAGAKYSNPPRYTQYARNPPTQFRSRSVTVPNLGGFAGLSFRYLSAKISMGYRADFFFGAMDGGIDTRKTYDRNFYGPYASISIGLGG